MDIVIDTDEEKARFIHSNERRKTSVRLTITQILERLQEIADVDFRGILQDNALAIFNRLPDDDKKTFLRHALALLWERQIELAQRGIKDIIIDDVLIDLQAVEVERGSIEDKSEEEMLKLSHYIARVIFISAFVVVISTIIFTFVYDPSGQNTIDFVKAIKAIVDFFF